MKKIIDLADIDVSHSPIVRAAYAHEIAEEYAEEYRHKKNTMPLPVLFQVGKSWLIGDGLHRINGMKMAGLKSHVFEILEGTKQDCLRYALLSNVGHGLRRTNADKWHCVKLALVEFNGLSDSLIADYCAVANSFVATVRGAMVESKELTPVDKRTGADGKVRPVNLTPTKVETSKTKEISEKDTSPVQTSEAEAGASPVDETGFPIPDKAVHIWERRGGVNASIESIENLKLMAEELESEKDLLYAEVNWKSVIADLANIRGQLLLAKPWAVCPACQAKLPERCKLCLGKGMVSKFRYDTTPEELKKMRGKHG